MPFMIGAVGRVAKSLEVSQHFSQVTHDNALRGSLSVLNTDHMVLLAGSRAAETWHGDKVIRLAQNGMFLGRLFDKAYCPVDHFGEEIGRAIAARPQIVLDRYWGRYIAVLYDRQMNRVSLVRDPLGLCTLFYHTSGVTPLTGQV